MTGPSVALPAGEPALRVVPMPADANHHGDIFGGWIMAQVDIAGAVPASRRARGRVATVAVNSFVFKQPVLIGDLVSFYADDHPRRAHVDHRRRRGLCPAQPDEEITVKVTEASLTYVAVGACDQVAPRPVPPAVDAAKADPASNATNRRVHPPGRRPEMRPAGPRV